MTELEVSEIEVTELEEVLGAIELLEVATGVAEDEDGVDDGVELAIELGVELGTELGVAELELITKTDELDTAGI